MNWVVSIDVECNLEAMVDQIDREKNTLDSSLKLTSCLQRKQVRRSFQDCQEVLNYNNITGAQLLEPEVSERAQKPLGRFQPIT